VKRLALIALLSIPALAFGGDDERNWKVEDQETIRRSFDASAGSGPQKLLVDNINGYIHVTGYAGKEVQVTVSRQTRAISSEAMAEAKRDVKLDMSQQGNFVRLYADGPFRDNRNRGSDYYGYRVYFDFDIQVPAATQLELRTVNHGTIEVRKTEGDFDVHGLNGGIEMEDVSGSGSVNTLNGPVKVWFRRNPAHDTEFHTLNGNMEIHFQPGLDADLSFHTLNGGVYTDFDVTALPVKTSGAETANGRFIYSSRRGSLDARAGKGGPQLSFHALNGAIRVYSKGI